MAKRTIVQLFTDKVDGADRLHALANDGTVWMREGSAWVEAPALPPLPQPEREPPASYKRPPQSLMRRRI